MTPRFGLVTRFLIWLGVRSACCGAPVVNPPGWPDLDECDHCGARCR